MVFSSLIFLFVFLPLIIMGNWVVREQLSNLFLLIGSLIFFAWGGVFYAGIFVLSLIMNYWVGRFIARYRDHSKMILITGVLVNLSLLGVFKYADFMVGNVNFFSTIFDFKPFPLPKIVLPIGISFYTFQAISYIVDVYRKEVEVQKKFIDMALYISFFPQLIAGPIIRYKDIAPQLKKRPLRVKDFHYGLKRFTLGLMKKVLIANKFGYVADTAFAIDVNALNTWHAWVGILAYTIQIYFDFSGYSDMAIGLGRMLGFKFPENFNYPYMARSIREFWQRWHMTLSIWFKNYLYFPLGGSRKGEVRTIVNLLMIFFATSIWHGASWNFVIWGMTHGFFMMLERLGLGKLLDKLWRPFQHFYALFIIVVTRVFFRAETFDAAWAYFTTLFSFNFEGLNVKMSQSIHNLELQVLLVIAILSCTPFWEKALHWVLKMIYRTRDHMILNASLRYTYYLGETSFPIIVLLLSTVLMLVDSYNPFIYFRF